MTWIQTFTGRQFDIENPRADMVCLEDIAHSLSMQCRYNGHCQHFYSVAEHSILVAAAVCLAKLSTIYIPRIGYSPDPIGSSHDNAIRLVHLLGLICDDPITVLEFGFPKLDDSDRGEVKSAGFHDGEETYTKDMPTPIKRMCPEYRALAKPIEACVFEAFGLLPWLPLTPLVKAADHEILFVEKAALMRHELEGWGAGIARDSRMAVFANALRIRCLAPAAAENDFLRMAEIMGVA